MNNGMELEARDIVVSRKGKVILDSVSFRVQSNTLTAIIGPNGAGKTTLMQVLSGERPDSGQVFINGKDIYTDPEYWLQQIGYVPVDNILHDHLTLQEALTYIGRLRLPRVPIKLIISRVDTLLTEFGFPRGDDRRDKQLRVLSSGERKRANVCSELIIDPEILMLDEPTSNLDPNAEYDLMSLLSAYAHKRKKTVLLITHTLNTIELCDEVVYIANGQLRTSGKPQDVLALLEKDLQLTENIETSSNMFFRWAQVFERTKTNPEKRRDYKRNSYLNQSTLVSKTQHIEKTPWLLQLYYLISRHLRVRLGDRWSFFGTLLAGLSGVLFFTLPGNAFIKPFDGNERALALNQARQAIYVISLVVTLLGMITSYTEISKEFRIFSHERLKGLSPSAYFLSKWIWLAVAVGVLAPIVLLIFIVFVYRQPLPGFPELRIGEVVGWWDQLIHFQLIGFFTSNVSWLILFTMILSCITSITLGLLISCAASDGGKGYLYLSFAVVFVVLFSGLIRNPNLEELINTLSYLSVGKWSYEGIASSIGIYCWLDSWRFDEFNSSGHILSVWLSLGAFIIVAMFLAITLLHLRDPWYGRWNNLISLFSRNLAAITVSLSILVLLFSYTSFLRSLSYEYHSLNYWSRSEYGGTGAYQYANVNKSQELDSITYWSGTISQSWCGDQ